MRDIKEIQVTEEFLSLGSATTACQNKHYKSDCSAAQGWLLLIRLGKTQSKLFIQSNKSKTRLKSPLTVGPMSYTASPERERKGKRKESESRLYFQNALI